MNYQGTTKELRKVMRLRPKVHPEARLLVGWEDGSNTLNNAVGWWASLSWRIHEPYTLHILSSSDKARGLTDNPAHALAILLEEMKDEIIEHTRSSHRQEDPEDHQDDGSVRV